MRIKNEATFPVSLALIILIIATLPLSLPYGYYVLLRLFVFVVAAYLVFIFYKIKKTYLMWIMIFIMLLFNPVIPVYLLHKSYWILIDIIVIGVFVLSLCQLKTQVLIDKLTEKQQRELFEKLKSWRWKKANELRVPAFFILHNSTLVEICRIFPKDTSSLREIKGIGERKLNLYGNELIEIIKEFAQKVV